jgi:hypothetical protein
MKAAFPYFGSVFTQFMSTQNDHFQFQHIQTALPWHLLKSYDELKKLGPGGKENTLSTVTSYRYQLSGHQKRIDFITYLKKKGLHIDHYGKGFRFLENKLNGLYNYKYSIAVENSFFEHYWTEKIADCFLSWTMPIYAGCPNIERYFPLEAMILIDLDDFQLSREIIEDAIFNKTWKKNLDAIATARELVLDQYQFFPFITRLIREYEVAHKTSSSETTTQIPAFSPPLSPRRPFADMKTRIIRRLKRLIP